jgi:hypothetical protein
VRDALVVMHARDIPECLASIRELDIPTLWMTGYTERGIADHAFPAVLGYDFDWLWVVSDDVIVRKPALDAVRRLRDSGDHPVVTGYSQGSHTEWVVNLTSKPLKPGPLEHAYTFRHYAECVSYPEPVIPTWFTGMSLTGMSRDLWLKHPFECFGTPGYASDFWTSARLQQDEVPIVAAREGFCYHWRHSRTFGEDERDAKPCGLEQEVVLA